MNMNQTIDEQAEYAATEYDIIRFYPIYLEGENDKETKIQN